MTLIHSALFTQWHPTKNGDVKLTSLTSGSGFKAWWIDQYGHEWKARVVDRTKGAGCPICRGKIILPGFNDFATKFPALAEEWHPTKNGDVTPNMVAPFANKTFWWLGACGHEWDMLLSDRTKNGSNCPYCAGRRVLVGFNDLGTTHPAFAEQFHLDKNVGVTVQEITAGSNKTFWWQDEYGHEWKAAVNNRTSKNQNCPICINHKILVGFNDLETTNPMVAEEWHPTKNSNLSPSQVTAGSKKSVWWQDKHGHEWKTTVAARIISGCPFCANKAVLRGFNDLVSTYPALAEEWHPTKNGKLTPSEVTAGADFYVWWLCSQGHEWEAYVYNRTSKKKPTICPQCSAAKMSSKPETTIADVLRELGVAVETANRKILGNKQEIDLYLPDHQLGVEFNGIYWHSEAMGKSRTYHYNKYITAQKAGIQLLQIWEDDWRNRPNVVLRAISHKLGLSEKLKELLPELNVETSRVFARKTTVVTLTNKQAQTFLETNHIQGFASGSCYIGLEDAEARLRAVLVLKRERNNVLNIVRYATSGTVVGGFTKLLKHAERTYEPDSFITFADHTISDGGLYENNGFVIDKELPPDYMYVVNGERKHKFGYRLKRFRNDPGLQFAEGLTEKELADLNNLPRIWDAGKTRYRYIP